MRYKLRLSDFSRSNSNVNLPLIAFMLNVVIVRIYTILVEIKLFF